MHTEIVETPPLASRTLAWHQEADCEAFAVALAQHRSIGNACIELIGPLGAGKTTFARHLLRALGVEGRIKSPSYAIVEPYTLPGLDAWHFDFYRFDNPREWEDAGFRDLFSARGLKLVEWPEKARALLPTPDLRLSIEPALDGQRTVQAQALTPLGQELLA